MQPADSNVRHVFEEGFCARDIAQTLRSFDAMTPLDAAAEVMHRCDCSFAGVRIDGVVTGYLHQDSLAGRLCGDAAQSFDDGQLVDATLPLAGLVRRLAGHPVCFVVAWEQPCGFVTKIDLQKPPGRMWLFGMVTLIETRFGRLIEADCTEEQWKACLSPGRIAKAESLQVERLKLGQQITLADCLQFADKAQIVARTERLREATRFSTKKQIEEIGRKLEKLRNNLAHSQEIINGDWETIVALAENVTSILDGPSTQKR